MNKKIIIVGYIGGAGAAEIAKTDREQLRRRFRPDYIDRIIENGDPIGLVDVPDCDRFHISEGGVLKTLFEIAEDRKCGMRIELKRVPFLQSTIELCELYGLNPYRLMSDAWVVLADDDALAQMLPQPAVVIGELTGGRDKVITDKTEIQYIDRPSRDEIYKFRDEHKR